MCGVRLQFKIAAQRRAVQEAKAPPWNGACLGGSAGGYGDEQW